MIHCRNLRRKTHSQSAFISEALRHTHTLSVFQSGKFQKRELGYIRWLHQIDWRLSKLIVLIVKTLSWLELVLLWLVKSGHLIQFHWNYLKIRVWRWDDQGSNHELWKTNSTGTILHDRNPPVHKVRSKQTIILSPFDEFGFRPYIDQFMRYVHHNMRRGHLFLTYFNYVTV